jgi:hypothetical protein
MGVLALSGGIYGITNPKAFASTLGIPITSPHSPALPFVSFVAARNLGSGVTMLVLIATGQRKAVGTVLICGVAWRWRMRGFVLSLGQVRGRRLGMRVWACGWDFGGRYLFV